MSIFISHEVIHFIFAILLSLFISYRFKNFNLILFIFFVTFFLDLDHLVDYLIYSLGDGKFTSPLITSYFLTSQKVIVPLHGWEWVIPLWLIGKKIDQIKKTPGLNWALSLAFLGHLLIDQLSYWPHPLGYFFTFRLLTNFSFLSFNGL